MGYEVLLKGRGVSTRFFSDSHLDGDEIRERIRRMCSDHPF
jgi:hypothetical protein